MTRNFLSARLMDFNQPKLKKSNFNLRDWKWEAKDGLTILTEYCGPDKKILVLPKPQDYPNLRVSHGLSFSTNVSILDLNYIPVIPDLDYFLYNDPYVGVVRHLYTEGNSAYAACSNMREYVEYPHNIENLYGAAKNCTSQTQPKLPDGAVDISEMYEGSCLKTGPYIPPNVRVMSKAFMRSEIEFMPTIPGNVEYMNLAFSGCYKLKKMPVILDGVKDMECAFQGSGITECTNLPNSVETISGAFADTRIQKPPILNNGLINMTGAFMNCSQLRYMPVIPESVVWMEGAFRGCHLLHKLRPIPKNVLNTAYTFCGCVFVKEPVPPGPLTTTCYGMYSECTELQYGFDMPDSVIVAHDLYRGCVNMQLPGTLGKYVEDIDDIYHNCTHLMLAPEIPEYVTDMAGAFWGCINLCGDIIIRSPHVKSAKAAFPTKAKNHKRVYIPYYGPDGEVSETYKTFKSLNLFEKSYQQLYNIEIFPLDSLEVDN